MATRTMEAVEVSTLRKPKVNKRNVSFNGDNKITLGANKHNPSDDSILVVGYKRTIREYSEIGASSLKKE